MGSYALSGWWVQPLWKILVNGKDYPIYDGNKTCLKPPASYLLVIINELGAVNPAIARKKSAICDSSQVPPVTRAMGILVAMTLSKYLGTWKKS